MTPDFEEMVDLTGLSSEDTSRLRNVHDMLVAAGPPAELPADLGTAPAGVGEAEVVSLASHRRRRTAVGALIAATVAAACFGGGYVIANQASPSAIHAVRVVSMQGNGAQQNSEASLTVGSADGNGNWPLRLTVNGLQPLPNDSRYYLMVWQGGKPAGFCGTFEVSKNGPTTVTFNVAYKITKSTKWVVTQIAPGVKFPGHVVMTTA
ncbi:MAG TPA: hypothetical protein VH063_12935 [Gaiellaceae bacterium]|jgi:hypothetical protein|nr:hypothetical protein [Gaiellaceae bacterium]